MRKMDPKNFLIMILLAMVLGMFAALARGQAIVYDADTVFWQGPTLTLSWDQTSYQCPAGETCGYEVELRSLEKDELIKDRIMAIGLDNLTATFQYKGVGHWKGYIRVWHTPDAADPTKYGYGDWGDSFVNGTVVINGVTVKRGWTLFWRMSAPTDPKVE